MGNELWHLAGRASLLKSWVGQVGTASKRQMNQLKGASSKARGSLLSVSVPLTLPALNRSLEGGFGLTFYVPEV